MIRILLIALFLATGTSTAGAQSNVQMTGKPLEGSSEVEKNPNLGLATLAGGCFWCTESDFRKVPGVIKVVSGYANGRGPNPTYENYADRGFVEAVQVSYDPQKVSYQELLDYFWRHIDPTDAGGQFVDRGPQYRSVIYYHDEEQRRLAEESKRKLASSGPIQKLGKPVATEITKFSNFYPAEDYHQDYAHKNPVRYKYYRWNAGRDQFLEKVWGAKPAAAADPPGDNFTKPSDEVLRKKLTPLQYKVTQQKGTEPPFKNEYNDNHREGIYVDILSGEPLYSSTDKFESGTGWPSFTKPLEPGNIVEREDRGWISVRTEVRSKHGDNHIGHVFNDGPPPTRLRYCMNSAALRFIPKEDLEKEGYGQYLHLFSQKK